MKKEPTLKQSSYTHNEKTKSPHPKQTISARRRIEDYWEHKTLETQLHDVLRDSSPQSA